MSSSPENYESRVRSVRYGYRDNTETAVVIPVVVTGVTGEIEAINYAAANLDKNINEFSQGTSPGDPHYLVLDELRVAEAHIDEADFKNNHFVIEATYQQPWQKDRQLKLGEVRLSFDTTGATDRLRYGLELSGTGNYKPASLDPDDDYFKDWGTAIGVRQNDVEGVTITIPSLRLQAEQLRHVDDIQVSHMLEWMQATGTMNDSFMFSNEFAIGELLFLGAIGGKPVDNIAGASVVIFNFEAKLNIGNIGQKSRPIKEVGAGTVDNVFITDAYGHDAIWAYHTLREGESSQDTIPRLRQINVVRAYEFYNLNSLFSVSRQDPTVTLPP